MCILFFHLGEGAGSQLNGNHGYRLILANNRDEHWERPTSTADFWGKDGSCLSSLDQEPGREGGTWLGMNRQGKIGVLLNILGENLPFMKGRGFLVSNFLTSDSNADDFLQELSVDVTTSKYNGFHLVLLKLGPDNSTAQYLTESATQEREGSQGLSLGGVQCFGNSVCRRPWQKVCHGRERFTKIIEESGTPESKNKLVESLMEFLNDRTPHIPDRVLETTCAELKYPAAIARERSANCVWSPSIKYGTRTNTVILVDWDGTCDYIERSLTTPIQPSHPQSNTKTFSFQINKI